MTIQLRSADDIAKMREAGRLAAEVLELIGEYVVPGVSTEELDRICHDHIVRCAKSHTRLSRLPWISQIGVHLDQSRGLSRHSLGEKNT